ncbi:S9 family peptidase [Chitinophaga pendula]|uniref:alpha/beta hydrolase family protein n=1 Tax=Chitinophaga TaxID=79328 RepID=UPI000BB002D6|nr:MULTISPECIES: lipase family protein [Chitinophaga]ASZ10737.1 hypothetical protein CK934_06965 [Chitinophaga sp. MD30]UCJ06286.1 S9 family peptidase [Chitinophaga pendula]
MKICFRKPNYVLWASLFVIALFANACRQDKTTPPQGKEKPTMELVREITVSKDDIQRRLSSPNQRISDILPIINSLLVKVYKVTYPTTDIDGQPITASGLMLIPNGEENPSLISFQHGTLTDPLGAPSLYTPGTLLTNYGPIVAALGYVVIAPDFLGYGSTSNIEHPYQHAGTLASATKDMIDATKILLKEKNINWDGKLYLSGYSEGGYATMAAYKLLEQKYPNQYNIRAVTCGAGAYDITNTAKYVLSNNKDIDTFFVQTYAWTLTTINRAEHINRPLNQLFNAPYDTELATKPIFKTVVPANPTLLFSQPFKDGIFNGTDHQFLNAFEKNNLYDWTPQRPILLLHADGDKHVPLLNYYNTVSKFISNGVPHLSKDIIVGKDHPGAIPDYIVRSVFFFLTNP